MGAGASVKRTSTSLQSEVDRLRERELDTEEHHMKEWNKEETKLSSRLAQLQSERNELAQKLVDAETSLAHQREGWSKEKSKTMTLTYSSLPLSLLSEEDMAVLERKPNFSSITKSFPMVTIAQSDVVGFSSLVARLKPQDAIRIIDHLHALIDESYSSKEIFIMERSSDSCTAVAGLVDTLLEVKPFGDDSLSSLSLADSSYGSENNLLDFDNERNRLTNRPHLKQNESATAGLKTASYYASHLATAVLNLMSASSKVSIPLAKQLQLRIALHSGPCSAGVLGLQTALGSSRIPQFKLVGPSVRHVNSLCRTGLALQIRVSKQCKDLLSQEEEEGFHFERCPDYMAWANRKPIESYWLVGKRNLPIKLPSLDLAISLSDYEDTD